MCARARTNISESPHAYTSEHADAYRHVVHLIIHLNNVGMSLHLLEHKNDVYRHLFEFVFQALNLSFSVSNPVFQTSSFKFVLFQHRQQLTSTRKTE